MKAQRIIDESLYIFKLYYPLYVFLFPCFCILVKSTHLILFSSGLRSNLLFLELFTEANSCVDCL